VPPKLPPRNTGIPWIDALPEWDTDSIKQKKRFLFFKSNITRICNINPTPHDREPELQPIPVEAIVEVAAPDNIAVAEAAAGKADEGTGA
jgi:hypothetical protein